MTNIAALKQGIDYDFISHTADIGIKVWAKSLSGIFEKSALVLSRILFSGIGKKMIPRKEVRRIVQSTDPEAALVAFLNEILFLFYTKHFVPTAVAVQLTTKKSTAILKGTVVPKKDFTVDEEIKATTYHELYIKRTAPGKYEAQVIFDV